MPQQTTRLRRRRPRAGVRTGEDHPIQLRRPNVIRPNRSELLTFAGATALLLLASTTLPLVAFYVLCVALALAGFGGFLVIDIRQGYPLTGTYSVSMVLALVATVLSRVSVSTVWAPVDPGQARGGVSFWSGSFELPRPGGPAMGVCFLIALVLLSTPLKPGKLLFAVFRLPRRIFKFIAYKTPLIPLVFITALAIGTLYVLWLMRSTGVMASTPVRMVIGVLWIGFIYFGSATFASCQRQHGEPVAESVPTTPHREVVHRWNTYLGAEKRALAGFQLVEPIVSVEHPGRDEVIGWKAEVNCPLESEGTLEVVRALGRIATTMQVTPASVDVFSSADNSRPWIQVIHRPVLSEGSAPWSLTGIDVEAGTFEMGTYADGLRSKYQLWTPDGSTWHGWLCGGTGSGKSSAAHALLGRVMSTGLVTLDLAYIGGGTMYAWERTAYRSGTTAEDAHNALRRGVAVMEARAAAAKTLSYVDRAGVTRIGRDPLPPGTDWPVYWIVIDEFPNLSTEGSREDIADRKKLISKIAKEGRKWRVALLVCSQGAHLRQVWFDDSILRQNVRQGNVMCLRSDKTSQAMVFDGFEGMQEIQQIPPGTPGMGYILSKASTRATMSRADWVGDTDDRPAAVPSSWEVADLAKPAALNPVDIEAIDEIERKHEITRASATAPATAPATAVASIPAQRTKLLAVSLDEDTEATPGTKVAVEVPEPTSMRSATEIGDEILDELGAAFSTGEFVERWVALTGTSRRRADDYLKSSPRVEKAGRGAWNVRPRV